MIWDKYPSARPAKHVSALAKRRQWLAEMEQWDKEMAAESQAAADRHMRDLYRQGETMQALAERYNISVPTVRKRLGKDVVEAVAAARAIQRTIQRANVGQGGRVPRDVVSKMRNDYREGKSVRSIARHYGYVYNTAYLIVKRRTFKDVT